MAEESARVAQRCEEAKSTSELLLCECGLRKFPDAVFFLMKGTELDKVDLSHNQLQKIPAKLGTKFASITMLDLSHNALALLPAELSNMVKLTTINLSSNQFPAVPEALRGLPALTTVDLSENRIEEVQREDYDSLHCLEVLNLKDNPLRDEIKMLLQSIVRLDIRT